MSSLIRQLMLSFLLAMSALLLSVNAFGVEMVTGEFIRAPSPNPDVIPIQITEISAHEATGTSSQKGYFFTHTDRDNDGEYDSWRLIDLRDTENTCVNVYGDGQARIGGLISDWNEGNGFAGRYLGYDLLDGGQPNVNEPVDFLTIILFIEPDPENIDDLLRGFKRWCDTGKLSKKVVLGAFPKYVMDGNLKIHNE